MAIRLEINGVPVVCDTADEATAMIAAAAKLKTANSPAIPAQNRAREIIKQVVAPGAPADKFAAFWGDADEEGRALLTLAAQAERFLYVADLPEKLGVEESRSNWVRRKLKDVGLKHGVDLDMYLPQTRVKVDGKPKTAYEVLPKLKVAIEKVTAA